MDEQAAVTLARIEGKLDLINVELRSVNQRGEDHEQRIRELEKRPALSGKQILAWLVSVATIAASIAAVLALVL